MTSSRWGLAEEPNTGVRGGREVQALVQSLGEL